MPAEIRGGPSRGHRLPNQADADAAEQALNRNLPPATRKPLPPPAPLPRGFEPGAEAEHDDSPLAAVAQHVRDAVATRVRMDAQIGGPQPLPQTEEDGEAPPPVSGSFTVTYHDDAVEVVLWQDGKRAYIAEGASLTEALSLAAGKLEEGLALPTCPTCGQVLPETE